MSGTQGFQGVQGFIGLGGIQGDDGFIGSQGNIGIPGNPSIIPTALLTNISSYTPTVLAGNPIPFNSGSPHINPFIVDSFGIFTPGTSSSIGVTQPGGIFKVSFSVNCKTDNGGIMGIGIVVNNTLQASFYAPSMGVGGQLIGSALVNPNAPFPAPNTISLMNVGETDIILTPPQPLYSNSPIFNNAYLLVENVGFQEF